MACAQGLTLSFENSQDGKQRVAEIKGDQSERHHNQINSGNSHYRKCPQFRFDRAKA